MAVVQHAYHYLAASNLHDAARPRLSLATSASSNTADPHPHFFEGQLRTPRLAAELLTALHLIVGSRLFLL